jgi:hypothetical protein
VPLVQLPNALAIPAAESFSRQTEPAPARADMEAKAIATRAVV